MAVGAANPRKTFLQIAAFEKGSHSARDHRSPEAVLGLKLRVVDLSECLLSLGFSGVRCAVTFYKMRSPKKTKKRSGHTVEG